jgi:hypothetical protein
MERVRRKRWISIASFVLLIMAVVLIAIQIGQWTVRRRAERLVGDFRALVLKPGDWQDAQEMMKRWGAWGKYDGTCEAHHCSYDIELVDPSLKLVRTLDGFLSFNGGALTQRAMAHLGARLPVVLMSFEIKDGILREVYLSIWTFVPKGYGPGWRDQGPIPDEEPMPAGYITYKSGDYTLVAYTKMTEDEHAFYAYPDIRQYHDPHPEYQIKEPSGCENCMALDVTLKKNAAPADVMRLTNFNFSCLTRWSPCAVQQDLSPVAWKQYVIESNDREIARKMGQEK